MLGQPTNRCINGVDSFTLSVRMFDMSKVISCVSGQYSCKYLIRKWNDYIETRYVRPFTYGGLLSCDFLSKSYMKRLKVILEKPTVLLKGYQITTYLITGIKDL